MGIVVQKYGGSSVADATSVKRVAQRIVATKKAGHDVVVVVSAMGDTTDELIDLANEVSPLPPARELDMLLTAGERISMAVLAMAIGNLGQEARSFTGSQAGVITDAEHGKAKIIDVTPGRIEKAIAEGAIAIVAGFQGVSQTTKDITTAMAGIQRQVSISRQAMMFTTMKVTRKTRLAASTSEDSEPIMARKVAIAPISTTGRSGTPKRFSCSNQLGSMPSSAMRSASLAIE